MSHRVTDYVPQDRLNGIFELSEDVLLLALRYFVYRDLLDAADHLMEEVGWTPITVAYAKRLRDLNERHQLWADELDLVRFVLDGGPAAL